MKKLEVLDSDTVEKCKDILESGSAELAYFSGGKRWGLEHGLSDIDIYVFGNFSIENIKKEMQEMKNENQIQFNIVSELNTESVIDYCDPEKGGCTTTRKYNHISNEQFMKWVSAVSYGQLIYSTSSGQEKHNRIDNQHVIRSAMSRWSILTTRHLEDSYGCLESGIKSDSLRAAVLALECAVNCLLAGEGDLYVGEKSLVRRVENSDSLRSAKKYLTDIFCYQLLLENSEDYPQKIREIARAASSIVNFALIEFWDEIKGPPPVYELPSCSRRNEFYALTRYTDAICITGIDKGYRTNEKIANYWSSMDYFEEHQMKMDIIEKLKFLELIY